MWHGSLANLYNVITDVRTRYGKPVVVAETAYPFTTEQCRSGSRTRSVAALPCDGLSASWQGQAEEFTWVQNTARNAGAIGVFYCGAHLARGAGQRLEPRPTSTTAATGWGTTWRSSTGTGRLNPNIRWLP